jgi:hypothetical protein
MIDKTKHIEIDQISIPFTQFIIAVNGTLIGYSLKHIEEKSFSLSIIPIGLAIIFWSLSFYIGISSVRKNISVRLIEAFTHQNPWTQSKDYKQKIDNKLEELSSIANKLNKYMYYLLYSGIICYLFWQGYEMYKRTFFC